MVLNKMSHMDFPLIFFSSSALNTPFRIDLRQILFSYDQGQNTQTTAQQSIPTQNPALGNTALLALWSESISPLRRCAPAVPSSRKTSRVHNSLASTSFLLDQDFQGQPRLSFCRIQTYARPRGIHQKGRVVAS